jgi:pimeloyl-ACP methyl ester carboxylesterase
MRILLLLVWLSWIPSAAVAGNLLLGTLQLRSCGGPSTWCGDVARALDPSGAVAGKIPVHFELHRHTAGRQVGTLVATEGGPGYPATLSRADYLALFKPLLATHDLLLMDNRGTGRSAAIDCPGLQSADHWTVPLIAECGASLGPRAALYSTAYAADDLAAILTALGVRKIDLYGDSYGTFFAQTFALRHPALLRSVTLDGAYPLDGPDYGWYPSYPGAVRDKFNLACSRSADCAALPGDSITHILPALKALRAHPSARTAYDSDGRAREFTADASKLAIVMYGGAPALATLRELDAAARAYAAGDQAPLLRLMAETTSAVDSRDPGANPALWSAGLAAAVMCQDSPQIFDMRLPPALRVTARDRAVQDFERREPDAYAPFDLDEYRGMPLDYSFVDQCVAWPAPPPAHPPANLAPAGAVYPGVPVLVISGELDSITTLADGAAVAAAFPAARQIRIANSFHVNALPRARSTCGAEVTRAFVQNLEAGEPACAVRVPPLRLVAAFAQRAAELTPAVADAGDASSPAALRVAHAAVATLGDALTRLPANASGRGMGLRGGRFRIAVRAGDTHVILDQVRWTADVAVSGSLTRHRNGDISAETQVNAGNLSGSLQVHWADTEAAPEAQLRGRLGAVAIAAHLPAP